MYQKNIENGYIVSIVKGVSNGNITENEYNTILAVIRNKPTAESGFDYRLKTDLTWELYELTIVEEQTAYTAEQLAEMTTTELKAICTELGIPTSMVKQNMIDLILGKQNNSL